MNERLSTGSQRASTKVFHSASWGVTWCASNQPADHGIIGRISHRARYAVHSRLLLICDSRLLCTRRSAMPKAKRKQLNIGITQVNVLTLHQPLGPGGA